jgi:hypothetical protein
VLKEESEWKRNVKPTEPSGQEIFESCLDCRAGQACLVRQREQHRIHNVLVFELEAGDPETLLSWSLYCRVRYLTLVLMRLAGNPM